MARSFLVCGGGGLSKQKWEFCQNRFFPGGFEREEGNSVRPGRCGGGGWKAFADKGASMVGVGVYNKPPPQTAVVETRVLLKRTFLEATGGEEEEAGAGGRSNEKRKI